MQKLSRLISQRCDVIKANPKVACTTTDTLVVHANKKNEIRSAQSRDISLLNLRIVIWSQTYSTKAKLKEKTAVASKAWNEKRRADKAKHKLEFEEKKTVITKSCTPKSRAETERELAAIKEERVVVRAIGKEEEATTRAIAKANRQQAKEEEAAKAIANVWDLLEAIVKFKELGIEVDQMYTTEQEEIGKTIQSVPQEKWSVEKGIELVNLIKKLKATHWE